MITLPIRKLMMITVVCFGWIFITDTQISYACSGGAPLNVEGLIANSDYVVKAHVVEQDDANQNVIVQVESYLAGGSGSEFLLLNRTDPLLVDYILNGRSSGADCLGLAQKLERSVSVYLFLIRNEDGSYSRTSYNNLYIFDSPYSTLKVYLEGDTEVEVSEIQFVDFIAQESGDIPTAPDVSYRYPLKAPLLIHTQPTDYILPLDWQPPVIIVEPEYPFQGYPIRGFRDASPCFIKGCTRISPDGLNVATIQGDGKISFTEGYGNWDGQELLFASTSDAVVIWNNCNMNIYTTGYPRLNQEWYQIEFINTLAMNAENCKQYHALATWTPDGRQLAYSDDDGIWLWDVYTVGSQPRLLLSIESSKMLIPNYFSPLGRYLNFSRDGVNKHLDIVSSEIIADGLISPDDRLLINYEEKHAEMGYAICSIINYECVWGSYLSLSTYDAITGEIERVYVPTSILKKTQWINKYSFIQSACVPDEPELCAVFMQHTDPNGWSRRWFGHGFDFTYDSNQDIIATLKDRHTIRIDGVEIDTSQWFDEEIINIEWLPSLFYYD